MHRRSLCRPSLKITRSGGQMKVDRFCIDVWNPFIHVYEPVNSVEEGVARADALANLIGRMWLERHPKRDALMDVPVTAKIDGWRWAEVRINATTFRSYDTRSDDCLAWVGAAGMKRAVAAICVNVGYMPQSTAAA